MGVSIVCTNPKYSFDMGCGGFYNLRKNVALSLDREFGELYSLLMRCYGQKETDETANRIQKYIDIHPDIFPDINNDILDFLFAPDSGGKSSYRTCKKIATLLEKNFSELDLEHKMFRYAAESHSDYSEFIDFLKDCYSNRKNMTWF